MSIYVRRPGSGLLVPFEVPELTIDESISRGWVFQGDSQLMEPKPDEFLATSPLWSQAIANWYYGTVVPERRNRWWV